MESRRFKLIAWAGIFGFVLLFLFHLHGLKILEEGNHALLGNRQRSIVYRYLIDNLQGLQSRFYETRLLARPRNADFYLLNLDHSIQRLEKTLETIGQGGVLVVKTPLNLPQADYTETEIRIPHGMIDRGNLSDILASFALVRRRAKELKELLAQRFEARHPGASTQATLATLRHRELVMIKDLDAVFRRMIENVNRIYYYDQQKIAAQKERFDQEMRRYRLIEYLSFLFLIALIGVEAYLYTRNLVKTNRQLKEKLYTDALTGLRTRHYLEEKIQPGDQSCLALIDLRHFGRLISLYGMGFADKLLKQVSSRLQAAMQESGCTLIHFNGDIFAVYDQGETKNRRSIDQRIRWLKELIESHDFIVDGISIDLRTSVGAAQGLRCREEAYVALQKAKSNGRGFQTFHGGDYRKELQNILEWERRIKQAIETNRVVPFFQPIVDREQNVVNYEALIRIAEGEGEHLHYLSPGAFLQIAKQTGQYEDLSRIMIAKTFAQSRSLGKFSLNIGAWEIENSDYWGELEALIEKYDAQGRLTFEILEHESFEDYDNVARFISRFKKLNVTIAIDDFGSGYSSLQRVLSLRPDYLKIDGSIIRKITQNSTEKELVALITGLARTMGAKTVAEFVEDREIFDLTKALGVDYFQGYYFAPPAPLEEIKEPHSL